MRTIAVRNTILGSGVPKIIAPIVGGTRQQILEAAARLRAFPVDLAEWRVDFFDDALDAGRVLDALGELRQALGELPLVFTFRTRREGGEKPIPPDAYAALNRAAARSGSADIVDIEALSFGEGAAALIWDVQRAGALVIGSNHDFASTPPQREIVARLRELQRMGCDIPKIAVMPATPADVWTLLSATDEMRARHADRPFVTMSMAGLGVASRVSGELFGSCMTFGTTGASSAPGQIPADLLCMALHALHDLL